MTPIVVFDSRQELVDITLELDEGRHFLFVELFLNGVEPYSGAAKQLTASWESLRGQLFNWSEVQEELTSLSPRRGTLSLKEAGHMIQKDQPQAATDAINRVVIEAARQKG